ncbi:hypothetical protein [Baekduia sp. Peel2402]|uniref:hypothetical protein n=1 Tax=Baekduia sp. Peel2402 TaxID=3458296 RepID=UPI00403E5B33
MAHQLTATDALVDLWHDVVDQAGVDEDRFMLLAVSGDPEHGGAKAAWFWPRLRVYAHHNVLTPGAAKEANQPANLRRHRVAIYSDFDAEDPVAAARIAAMLRHEVRHAQQFDACGKELFELDHILEEVSERAAPGASNARDLYWAKPIELDANRAAAMYLRDRRPDTIAGILTMDDDTILARETTAPGDPSTLREQTFTRLWELRDMADDPMTFTPPADVADLLAGVDASWATRWRARQG